MTERPNVCPYCEGAKIVWRGGQGGDYEPCSCVQSKPLAPSDKPRWPCPGQSISPSDAEIEAVVREAIAAWKTARELPYLSPSACKLLNDLIVAGLRPVLGGKR